MEPVELDQLMAEVGAQDDRILACIKTPDGAFAIRFEELDVVAEWDETRKRLVLSSEVGTPPRARLAHIYETLLSYNLLYQVTGGVHLALTGRGGSVLQLVDLADAEIEPRQIAIVAVNLASLATIWQAYFESEEGGEDAVSAPPAMTMADMIRA